MTSKSTIYRKAKWPVLCKKNKDGKVIEFTIEEDRWSYVDNNFKRPNGDPRLLNDKGAMCCLGFYSRACGISPIHLFEESCPSDIYKKLTSEMLWLLNLQNHDSSYKAHYLMRANDNSFTCPLSVRKKEIKKIFKQQGVKVKFVKSLNNNGMF